MRILVVIGCSTLGSGVRPIVLLGSGTWNYVLKVDGFVSETSLGKLLEIGLGYLLARMKSK